MRPHRHQARLRERRRAVIQRSVRDLHAGQVRHHRLVFVEQLQRALARLGLIRRIRAVEFAARHDRPHRGRNVMLVGAGAEEIERPTVALRARGHQPPDLHFRQRFGNARERFRCAAAAGISSNNASMPGAPMAFEHFANVGFGMGDEGHGDVVMSVVRCEGVKCRWRSDAAVCAAWTLTSLHVYITTDVSAGVLDDLAVGGRVQQLIQFGRVARLHLEQPALRRTDRSSRVRAMRQALRSPRRLRRTPGCRRPRPL